MAETQFGRYQLLELLGRGGMGEVWRAHDTATDRIVALKLLPAHLSHDEVFQERFRREAHAAARLNNPHVIPIHFYGEIDGRLYVDMRLIEGRDLDDRAGRRPAGAVAGGPHHRAGGQGVACRTQGRAGAPRCQAVQHPARRGRLCLSDRFRHRARRQRDGVDRQPAVSGDGLEQQYGGHVATPPPRPSTTAPTVPAAFDEVIATGMARDPDDRYAATVALARAAQDAITTPDSAAAPAVAPPPPRSPNRSGCPADRRRRLRLGSHPAAPAPRSADSASTRSSTATCTGTEHPPRWRRRSVVISAGVVLTVVAVIVGVTLAVQRASRPTQSVLP